MKNVQGAGIAIPAAAVSPVRPAPSADSFRLPNVHSPHSLTKVSAARLSVPVFMLVAGSLLARRAALV